MTTDTPSKTRGVKAKRARSPRHRTDKSIQVRNQDRQSSTAQIEQLKQFMISWVDDRLAVFMESIAFSEESVREEMADADTRPYQEVLREIERVRWTPPPGAKTSLEILREDRDR